MFEEYLYPNSDYSIFHLKLRDEYEPYDGSKYIVMKFEDRIGFNFKFLFDYSKSNFEFDCNNCYVFVVNNTNTNTKHLREIELFLYNSTKQKVLISC